MMMAGRIGVMKNYRLRWRFDFANKPSRFGIWDDSGGSQLEASKTAAWCVNKDGLIRAAIEGEDTTTFQISPLYEADGHDYVNFSWVRATPAPFLGEVNHTLTGHLIALTMQTRNTHTTLYIDGSKRVDACTADDMTRNLAGFGR